MSGKSEESPGLDRSDLLRPEGTEALEEAGQTTGDSLSISVDSQGSSGGIGGDWDRVTNSLLDSHDRCPRRAYYGYVAGGTGIEPTLIALPLAIGSAYHAAAEIILEDYQEGFRPADPVVEMAVYDWIHENQQDLLPDQKPLIAAHAVEAAKLLRDRIATEDWTIEEVEGVFVVPLYPGVKLTGRRDAIIRTNDHIRMLLDHKTKGKLTGNALRQVPTNAQLLRYTWAEQQTGGIVDEVALLIVKKSALKGRKNESSAALHARIQQDYRTQGQNMLHLERVTPLQEDIDDCIEATRESAKDFLTRVKNQGPWPRHTTGCEINHSLCEFFEICREDRWTSGDPPIGFRQKSTRFTELQED